MERKLAMAVTDGVAATNGTPWSIFDHTDAFRKMVEEAGSIEIITPANADEYDWQVYSSQLDLDPAKVKRIFLLRQSDTITSHFASIHDYDI